MVSNYKVLLVQIIITVIRISLKLTRFLTKTFKSQAFTAKKKKKKATRDHYVELPGRNSNSTHNNNNNKTL